MACGQSADKETVTLCWKGKKDEKGNYNLFGNGVYAGGERDGNGGAGLTLAVR